MTMWIKMLKCEIFRQFRNPLCIAYLFIPFLSVIVSFITIEDRIEMFEMVCGSYAAGTLTMFMRDNIMAWLVISVLLTAQNISFRTNQFFNRTIPSGRVTMWGVETLFMWIISAVHWSIFFMLLGISSIVLIGTSFVLRIMVVGTIFTCGGIMVMSCAIARLVRNPLLFTIFFFFIFVIMNAISGFQNHNIFAYAVITPTLISDFNVTSTVKFMSLDLPIYYMSFWFIGLIDFYRKT